MLQRAWFHFVIRPALLLRDRRGQDLLEYALLGGFIAVAVAAFFPTSIAPNISQILSRVSSMLNSAPGTGS